jgi:hypothetical protein
MGEKRDGQRNQLLPRHSSGQLANRCREIILSDRGMDKSKILFYNCPMIKRNLVLSAR